MTEAEARELVEQFWHDFATNDLSDEGFFRHYTEDVLYQDSLDTAIGKDQIREFWEVFNNGIKQWTCVRHQTVVDSEGFSYDWTLRGYIDETVGPLPGTGQEIEMRGITIGTFRDGLVATNLDNWDLTTLLHQVGATELPAPE